MTIRFPYLIITLILMTSFTVKAGDLNKDLQDFFNKVGGSASVNDAGAYDAQAAGLYTLGSAYTRVPTTNTRLVDIKLPSFSAGCGGIDAFTGAFSMINSDQLVATGKAIASNAVMYAFELGLSTLSPMISSNMRKSLADLQKWTQFELNSCEAAQGLVGGLWPKADATSRAYCQSIGRSKGIFTDAAAARHGCGTEKKRTETLESDDKLPAVETNIAWEAIKKNSLISSKQRELFMTMSGTAVLRKQGKGDDAPLSYVFFNAKADSSDVIDALLYGRTVKIMGCDKDKENRCLNPEHDKKEFHVRKEDAFLTRINALLEKVSNHMLQDKPLDGSTHKAYLDLLNKTSLPLHKMLAVNTAYRSRGSTKHPKIDLSAYSELIALDITFEYLDDTLQQVLAGSGQVHFVDTEKMQAWQSSVSRSREQIRSKQRAIKQNLQVATNLIQQTHMMEKMLTGELTSRTMNTIYSPGGSH